MSNKDEQADARLEHLLRRWGADTQAAQAVTSPAPVVARRPLRPDRWLWRLAPVAVAACVLIGFGLGRVMVPHSTTTEPSLASMEDHDRRPLASSARSAESLPGADIASGEGYVYEGRGAGFRESDVGLTADDGERDRADYVADGSPADADELVWRDVDEGLLDLRMQRAIVSRSDQNALQIANRYLQRRLVETEEALAQTNIELTEFKGTVDTLNEQVVELETEVTTQMLALAEQTAVLQQLAPLADAPAAQAPSAPVSTMPTTPDYTASVGGGMAADDMYLSEADLDWEMIATNTQMIAGYEAEQELLREEVEESRRQQARLAVSVTQLANRMAEPPARSLRECQTLLANQELMIQLASFTDADDQAAAIESLLDSCQVLLLRLSMLEDTPEAIAGYQALMDELNILASLGAVTRRDDLSPELLACLAQTRLLLTEVRNLE